MKESNNYSKEEAMLWFQSERLRFQQQSKESLKKLWNNLKKFNSIGDVPTLPHAESPEEWKNFYVVKLIEAGAIPKSLLKDDGYYLGSHRRAVVAQWKANENSFFYKRTKFNYVYIDNCKHFEDDDGFALFVPIAEATQEQYEKNRITPDE